jgi:hypothetical protein
MTVGHSSSDHNRRRLTQLRNGLLRLHKVLLDSETATYEREIARIRSKGQLLDLVLHDPWFASLHELSELIVLIDETLATKEPAKMTSADFLIRKARRLLVPAEHGTGFKKQYFDALQRDPNVVMAHAEMRKVFAGLG